MTTECRPFDCPIDTYDPEVPSRNRWTVQLRIASGPVAIRASVHRKALRPIDPPPNWLRYNAMVEDWLTPRDMDDEEVEAFQSLDTLRVHDRPAPGSLPID